MPSILITAGIAATLSITGAIGVGAQEPFLCPVMSPGALSAPGLNGTSVNSVGALPSSAATIVPGNNQAGASANPSAYNASGSPSATNVPGTPGFTSIWNP
jgi:hypothetical protein